MSVNGPSDLRLRRLLAAADLAGDADGRVTRDELEGIQAAASKSVVRGEGVEPEDPLSRAQADAYERAMSVTERGSLATLSEPLARLPAPLRRLALEVDALWGDADGQVTTEELDRIARYTLAALPFFTKEAAAIVELAEYLGFDEGPRVAEGVLALRVALAEVDRDEVARGSAFKALFDEALAAGEVAGLPEMLRDAATHSPRWHSLGILEHTAVAVAAARSLSRSLDMDWRAAGATLLLHDVGKILERHAAERGFHYGGHEELGARWLEERGLPDDVAFHVRHHADLRGKSVEEMVALFESDERLQQAIVVYVADQIAKGVTPDQLASFDEQAPKIATLCARSGLDPAALFRERRALLVEHFGVDVGLPASAEGG